MTCFWDGILKSLKKEDLDFVKYKLPKTPKHFIEFLKKQKKPMNNVLWQNKKIRQQEIEEYLLWIDEYNIKNISKGHLTSVCDTFLLLICELFCVNIKHQYIKYNTIYK